MHTYAKHGAIKILLFLMKCKKASFNVNHKPKVNKKIYLQTKQDYCEIISCNQKEINTKNYTTIFCRRSLMTCSDLCSCIFIAHG